MSDTIIHVVGHVGNDVERRTSGGGHPVSTFRLATTPRHWDRTKQIFVDDVTNWMTVECWRSLAVNVAKSVRRGQPVVVVGKLKIQEWVKDGVRHTRVLVDAMTVGHDLARGEAEFTKVAWTRAAPFSGPAVAPAPTEPIDAEPVEAEPVEAEPVEAEPVEAEPMSVAAISHVLADAS